MEKRAYLIIFLFIQINIFSEISVDVNLNLGSNDIENLESTLEYYVISTFSEYEETLEDSFNKPKILSAFTTSSNMAQASNMTTHSDIIGRYFISIGGSAGGYSKTWDPEELEESIRGITPSVDLELGANIQLLNINLSSKYFTVGFSFIDLEKSDYFYQSASGTIYSGLTPFSPIRLTRNFSINPLSLAGGISYSRTQGGVTIYPGILEGSFQLDPDGGGPLTSEEVGIELDPVIEAGMVINSGILNFLLSSDLYIRDIVTFSLGSGVYQAFGEGNFYFKGNSDIELIGSLSSLLEESGSMNISGSIGHGTPKFFVGYIFTNIRVNFGGAFITFNALFNPPKGLALGITTGYAL